VNRTPLFQVQLEAGAQFIDFGGWEMPVRFSNELNEHAAVRTDCGVFDVSHMGQIWISGADSPAALDFALVSKPSNQQVGQAKYSMICNSAAGILDDLIVYRVTDTDYLIVANAANAPVVLHELQQRIARFDAVAERVTPERCLIAIQGPNSEGLLASLGINLGDLGYYRFRRVFLDGEELWVARTGYTGEDGFEISIGSQLAPAFWRNLVAAGATPCGLAARDTLRLEAGMPLYGHELTAELTPYDVGMSRVVSLDKSQSSFGAQELAAAAIGSHRYLVGLFGEGKRAARAGYQVLGDDKPLGQITSGALSPSLGFPIAMADVSVELQPGDMVQVDIRGQQQEFRVTKLPFYKRAKN
jgi:aminomethyltransferase